MSTKKKGSKSVLLGVAFLLCFCAAGIGSLFTTPSIPTWYVHLVKPFFNPPNWIFGPVWTVLYALMAVVLYLVWISKTHEQKRKQGEWYFYLQLFCNTLWSIVFFGMHNPHVALGIVVALWLFIFFTIREFLKIQKRAAYLLFPYLAWVSFASVLNLCIVLLN